MSLVSSGTSTGRAEVEDRRRSSDWVATIFGFGARAAECSVSVMCNVLVANFASRKRFNILYLNARLPRKNVTRSLNDYTRCILSRVV